LLSGIAECGTPGCSEMVRSGGVKHGLAVCRCATGAHVKRQVAVVDALVVTHLLRLFDWRPNPAPERAGHRL